MNTAIPPSPRKVIHIDMDCFYAAVEIRDNPELADKPVAVGAKPEQRGVICTCNYIARQYGVRSAMATSTAFKQCKDLVLIPVNMPKYKQTAKRIHAIFREFTERVEPLALDEAYLDVTDSPHYEGSATLIAKAIRKCIWEEEKLTASAGVAPNKFLAKIASGWKKPNGLFVIRPEDIDTFIKTLPVKELFGVGKVMAEKLHTMGLQTCADLQKIPLAELVRHFGKMGHHLYEQSHGIDHRLVEPNRARKSLSVERTFNQDLNNIVDCLDIIRTLHESLMQRLAESAPNRAIKNQYVKIKYSDFQLVTTEMASTDANLERYLALFRETHEKNTKAIRLIGLGVNFQAERLTATVIQETLF